KCVAFPTLYFLFVPTSRLADRTLFPYTTLFRSIEELLADYRQRHPALRQLVFRPGTVLGAETRNQITELFMAPRLLALKGSDSPDRKSTRLNSSHVKTSYAVFCLKKKKQDR